MNILSCLTQPRTAEDLLKRLPGISRRELTSALDALLAEGKIMKNKKGRYGTPEQFGYLAGVFLETGRSFSFVRPDAGEGDVFIPPRMDGGAWQGDRVLVKSLTMGRPRDRRRGRQETGKLEGQVVRVLSRNKKDVYGRVIKVRRAFFVKLDTQRAQEVEIAKNKLLGAQIGDRVAVKMVFWGDKKYPPQGVVTEVLGENGTMEASIASILHENGVYDRFPDDALEQADKAGNTIGGIGDRLDLREKLIFTIDGDDAKDFDDAVSLEKLPDGKLLLGVHIADVSHYVTPASPLDTEAYRRGTSVYYPGRVVPMLPLPLSNGICSLNPQEDRYAFSAFITLDAGGGRHGARFAKSVIRSSFRLTYQKVNEILAGKALEESYPQLVENLVDMDALAKALRAKRMERGALELDIPEAELYLDKEGHTTEIVKRARGDAEKLIEEFMLLANESVAEYLYHRNAPAVYRVHEDPDIMKLRAFADMAKLFGYKMKGETLQDTHVLQKILEEASKHPEQRALPILLLRSLARARYAPQCIGHYGLAAKFYLHFTSPIRRYPDLVTHRMLEKQLSGGVFRQQDWEFCEEAAVQSTDREYAADQCERAIDKLYMADYMSRFIGESFDGIVSGVQGFGFFVQLENTVEGLVRLDTIKNDTFDFDEERLTLVSKRTGRRFALGSSVKVTVLSASGVTGMIDFVLA